MQIHKLLKLLFLLVLVILIGRIVIGKEQQKGLEEIEEIPLEDTSGFIVSDITTQNNPVQTLSTNTYENKVLGSKVPYNADLSDKRAFHDWIDDLAMCESSNREDIVILDTNKKNSYGCLQFQRTTWDHYIARYDLPYTDIMNCEHQKDLVSKMLEENYGNWKHWFNCTTKKIGYPYK
jgi:hypothetical protein